MFGLSDKSFKPKKLEKKTQNPSPEAKQVRTYIFILQHAHRHARRKSGLRVK